MLNPKLKLATSPSEFVDEFIKLFEELNEPEHAGYRDVVRMLVTANVTDSVQEPQGTTAILALDVLREECPDIHQKAICLFLYTFQCAMSMVELAKDQNESAA